MFEIILKPTLYFYFKLNFKKIKKTLLLFIILFDYREYFLMNYLFKNNIIMKKPFCTLLIQINKRTLFFIVCLLTVVRIF